MDGNRSDTRARHGDRDPLLKFQLRKNDYCHFCQSFIGLRMLEILDQKKFFAIRTSSLTSVDLATSSWLPGWCRTIGSNALTVKRLW
jgi:hypothetical protein